MRGLCLTWDSVLECWVPWHTFISRSSSQALQIFHLVWICRISSHFNQIWSILKPPKSKCFAKVLCSSFSVSFVPWVSLSSLTWNADQDDQGQALSCPLALTKLLQVKVGSTRRYHGLFVTRLKMADWRIPRIPRAIIDHWVIETFFCLSMLAVHPTTEIRCFRKITPQHPCLQTLDTPEQQTSTRCWMIFRFCWRFEASFPRQNLLAALGNGPHLRWHFSALSAPRLSISIRMSSAQYACDMRIYIPWLEFFEFWPLNSATIVHMYNRLWLVIFNSNVADSINFLVWWSEDLYQTLGEEVVQNYNWQFESKVLELLQVWGVGAKPAYRILELLPFHWQVRAQNEGIMKYRVPSLVLLFAIHLFDKKIINMIGPIIKKIVWFYKS